MTSVSLSPLPGGVTIHKTADETVNNSAAYQDDDHLFFAVGTTGLWLAHYRLLVTGNATADIKVQLTVPAGAVVIGGSIGARSTDAVAQALALPGPALGAAATVQVALIEAVVTLGGAAGVVTLQWAQNAATVGDTTVLKGSSVHAERVE